LFAKDFGLSFQEIGFRQEVLSLSYSLYEEDSLADHEPAVSLPVEGEVGSSFQIKRIVYL
jgi:hypothetical protein